MKKFMIAIALIASLFVMGCATVTVPVSATSNPMGEKVGQASGRVWFGIFGTADAGIKKAAENAGISQISSVDLTTKLGILGLWVDFEATVTGN